ncbi:amidohydrolase [Bifidobacterium oedipodis]|uniref:Amidohydrolase n=1 Tax=Bifidobacterium oedipodis TaxID=2675322 RepID=A0A7Y0HRG6_9BIFI|nr:amidohydrolase [Bifidobacterium sp. DSM 109957]NMM92881.1 amidohydrolase [Bifidobacterium sp. DSM 109957]
MTHTIADLPKSLTHRDIGHGAVIRIAREDEYPVVAKVLVEAFEANDHISDLYRNRLQSIAQRSEREHVWVAEDADSRIIGAYLTPKPDATEEPDTFGFNTLGVLPTAQGRGVGRSFVRHALDLGRFFGFPRLLIHSGPNMKTAHRLYYRCGFVRHRELETLVVDGGQRLLVFVADTDDPVDFDELEQEYRWFHAHPELSYQEFATTERIKAILQRHGVEILDTDLSTGLIAVVRGTASESHAGEHSARSQNPVIALRGDIDGLPLREDTGLLYASTTPGVAHACGHDINLTVALGAALLLQRRRAEFAGTVKIIFQPAEEVKSDEHTPTGAVRVLNTHALDDVDVFFGTHDTAALPVGVIGVREGGASGAVDKFQITITGRGTHAAHPDGGVNPISVLSSMVDALQAIAGQRVDPTHPRVLTVTHVEAGTTWNIVPEQAFLEGTVRTCDPADRDTIEQAVRQVVGGVAAAWGASADLVWSSNAPAVINDVHWAKVARQAVNDVELETRESPATLGGEDFSYYTQVTGKPGLFVHVGVGSSHFAAESIHSPRFTPDPRAIVPGAQFLSQLAVAALQELNGEKVQ